MCGFAVAIDWEGAASAVTQMLGGILHRGDVTDPLVAPFVNSAMGTRRLRIVDGDHAVQPQASPDGRILVSFNGEIYNHAALRAELMRCGLRFRTESDTEVLAAALQHWGVGALCRLVGMFAFVAVDVRTGHFVAVRDRFGVKPLYFIKRGTGYLFCSEIRPLLAASDTGDVLAVPPGHRLTRDGCVAYHVGAPAAEGDLDRLLADAVESRLPPGLPVAVLFSGGIDSTLIAHYARRVRPEIPGYFLGGPEAPDYEFAAHYADMSGMDFRMVPLEGCADGTLLDEVIATTEAFEPSVVRGGLCSYLVARAVHDDGFRVALCGEGADELFCGYRPLELVFAEGRELGDPVRQQCLSLMHRTSLQRVDRCSMRFQLETREPFLDPSIVNYAMALDAAALVNEHTLGKMPLRQIYDRYPHQLPRTIRDRRKIPFNEGTGFDASQNESPWVTLAEEMISDRALADGKREFAAFAVSSKEDLFYLRILARTMDVARVPHLRDRGLIRFPKIARMEGVKEYATTFP